MAGEFKRAEDDLAEAITEAWGTLDAKAAAENSAENRKNEALILEWANKLAEILKGPKK